MPKGKVLMMKKLFEFDFFILTFVPQIRGKYIISELNMKHILAEKTNVISSILDEAFLGSLKSISIKKSTINCNFINKIVIFNRLKVRTII